MISLKLEMWNSRDLFSGVKKKEDVEITNQIIHRNIRVPANYFKNLLQNFPNFSTQLNNWKILLLVPITRKREAGLEFF